MRSLHVRLKCPLYLCTIVFECKMSFSLVMVQSLRPIRPSLRIMLALQIAGTCMFSEHDMCCRGLIIVTAIVSTNRFFQKLSGLVDPLESAGDSAAADGSTKKTSATPQSTESQTSVPETLPSPSAVMNVTLQADTGETHISLSSSDLLYDTSQGDGTKDERYEDFFDVAAAAVRGAMVDERQDDGPQGSGSDTASSGDADPLQEGPGASSSENDNREIQKWISASEARASRSKNTGDQGGMLHQLRMAFGHACTSAIAMCTCSDCIPAGWQKNPFFARF